MKSKKIKIQEVAAPILISECRTMPDGTRLIPEKEVMKILRHFGIDIEIRPYKK